MTRFPLVEASELAALLKAPGSPVLVFDCSFDLTNPAAGPLEYAEGHIPGAAYLHLDDDLSAPKTGRNGRHPLPAREAFAQRIAAAGGDPDTLIVGYDHSGGMFASRLWWMLRWVGHANAALLNGGLAAWLRAGQPISRDPAPARAPGRFGVRPALVRSVDTGEVRANLQGGRQLVIDARNADRFRGENEVLDPVAGHIPGAVNKPFGQNLAADGRFKLAAQLRAEYDALTGGRPGAELILQCGSGVSACLSLVALEVAGVPGAALYPGSWSEWCAAPDAPVARGAD
jgi:thiosulfate/3-mercaptopyruvate sulfurtransferase